MAAFFKSRRFVLLVVLFSALLLSGAALRGPTNSHLRAMSVLLKFSDPQAQGFGVQFAQHPIREEAGVAQTAWGPLKYRLYIPTDISHPGGIVVVPGVHHLGIEHPGAISFGRAIAGAGVEVMTAEIHDLTDYRITPQSADLIGTAAVLLSGQIKQPRVGILGLSFAGGLALMAAAKPEYSDKIAFVFAIGAHDDLSRVARFFATNTVEKPDGTVVAADAHEYGAFVLVNSHLEDFFPANDIPAARDTMRFYLWEQPEDAAAASRKLSPAGQAMFDQLVHHRDQLQQKLLDGIKLHHEEMEAVSPHGHIENLTVPVFLLHGSGDNVIPPAETMWLSRDLPTPELKAALISQALIHVKMEDTVTLGDKWALVDFLSKVLDGVDRFGT
ncbi:MAG TPA: alpha/beta fold hydrolase [Candidatus Angelobacter sp.]|nr:alpha/beta fold hydrolase [Candidatus Angelobacter sp.]